MQQIHPTHDVIKYIFNLLSFRDFLTFGSISKEHYRSAWNMASKAQKAFMDQLAEHLGNPEKDIEESSIPEGRELSILDIKNSLINVLLDDKIRQSCSINVPVFFKNIYKIAKIESDFLDDDDLDQLIVGLCDLSEFQRAYMSVNKFSNGRLNEMLVSKKLKTVVNISYKNGYLKTARKIIDKMPYYPIRRQTHIEFLMKSGDLDGAKEIAINTPIREGQSIEYQ